MQPGGEDPDARNGNGRQPILDDRAGCLIDLFQRSRMYNLRYAVPELIGHSVAPTIDNLTGQVDDGRSSRKAHRVGSPESRDSRLREQEFGLSRINRTRRVTPMNVRLASQFRTRLIPRITGQ